MDAAELRSAIERQAAAVGLRFEADLAATILDQVRGEPGAMPLLQHALRELWLRRHGRWLLASEYRAIGGVQGAIAKTAEAVYAGLGDRAGTGPRHLRAADAAGRGEAPDVERRDTRRRVALEELVPVGGDVAPHRELVARLASAGLVVTSRSAPVAVPPEAVPSAAVAAPATAATQPRRNPGRPDPAAGRDEVEVAHEALIRHWPRLREWLEADRAALLLRETMREAAQEWERQGRDESYLAHRGRRLEEAEALAQTRFSLNAQERAYLDAALPSARGKSSNGKISGSGSWRATRAGRAGGGGAA